MKLFGKIFGHQRDEVNVISWLNCRDGCCVKWCKVSSNGVMMIAVCTPCDVGGGVWDMVM
jgi:hypothetical protein